MNKQKQTKRMSPIVEMLPMKKLSKLEGSLDFPMTNDYLFRALLQENNQVLKALICALLHLDEKSVQEVVVENPIELGKSYDEKDLILDIKALLNGNIIINLEMQVVNEHNWKERSLCYLCRSFDNLNRGMDYSAVKPAIQIGILNFSLFPESCEFYANYYMMNEKTNQKYSDKFRLIVVDLTQIKLATEEDRAYKIDQWAQFFKSKDWSELAMLAKENSDIQAAVGTVYQLSKEKQIRQQCEAREDYYKRERDRQRRDAQAELRSQQLEEKEREIEKKEKRIEQKEQAVEQKKQEIEQKEQAVEQKEQAVEQKEQAVEQKEQAVEQKEQKIEQKEQKIEQKEQQIEEEKQSLLQWEQSLKAKELEIERLKDFS